MFSLSVRLMNGDVKHVRLASDMTLAGVKAQVASTLDSLGALEDFALMQGDQVLDGQIQVEVSAVVFKSVPKAFELLVRLSEQMMGPILGLHTAFFEELNAAVAVVAEAGDLTDLQHQQRQKVANALYVRACTLDPSLSNMYEAMQLLVQASVRLCADPILFIESNVSAGIRIASQVTHLIACQEVGLDALPGHCQGYAVRAASVIMKSYDFEMYDLTDHFTSICCAACRVLGTLGNTTHKLGLEQVRARLELRRERELTRNMELLAYEVKSALQLLARNEIARLMAGTASSSDGIRNIANDAVEDMQGAEAEIVEIVADVEEAISLSDHEASLQEQADLHKALLQSKLKGDELPCLPALPEVAALRKGRLVLHTYTSFRKDFRDKLLQTTRARELVVQGELVAPDYANGRLVLAAGVTDKEKARLNEAPEWHVAMRVDDEDKICADVKHLLRKEGERCPKPLRSGGRFAVPDDESLFHDVSEANTSTGPSGPAADPEQFPRLGPVDLRDLLVRRTFLQMPTAAPITPRTCTSAP